MLRVAIAIAVAVISVRGWCLADHMGFCIAATRMRSICGEWLALMLRLVVVLLH